MVWLKYRGFARTSAFQVTRGRGCPGVAAPLAARRAVESRGWTYEIWSEPPQAKLESIRFLAGFRRDRLFSPDLVGELLGAGLDGITLGHVSRLLPAHCEHRVRATVHHLLWKGSAPSGRACECVAQFPFRT